MHAWDKVTDCISWTHGADLSQLTNDAVALVSDQLLDVLVAQNGLVRRAHLHTAVVAGQQL